MLRTLALVSAVAVLASCHPRNAAADDGGTPGDDGGASSSDAATSLPPDAGAVESKLTLSGSGRVRTGGTLPLTATLTGVADGDDGKVNLTVNAGEGTLSTPACTRNGATSTCTATFTAGATPGPVTVGAVSANPPARRASLDFSVLPQPTLTIDRTTVDLLAFAQPPPSTTITATVKDLFPGDSSEVTFTTISGTSLDVTAGADGHSVSFTPVMPASGRFYYADEALRPGDTVLRATSVAEPSLTADVVVHVHAFVDEGAALNLTDMRAMSVALASNGDVAVGGTIITPGFPVPSLQPVLLVKKGGGWITALKSGTGAISNVAAVGDGSFLAAGVTSLPDGNGNAPALLLHCAASCGGNLATNVGSVSASGIDVPRVGVVSGQYKYFAFTRKETGCNGGRHARVLYSLSIDAPLSAGNIFRWGGDDPAAQTWGNSCPFNEFSGTAAPNSALTGLAFLGADMWVAGYADCGTPACTHDGSLNPFGFHGLSKVTVGTNLWSSYQAAAVKNDVPGANLKVGYDGSLIGINSLGANNNFPGRANLFFFGSPTLAPDGLHTAPPSGASDTGLVASGSVTGGSAWAGSERELFYVYERRDAAGPIHYFEWQKGSDAPQRSQIDYLLNGTPQNVLITDLALAKVNGNVEGWAVGYDTKGTNVRPVIAHLK